MADARNANSPPIGSLTVASSRGDMAVASRVAAERLGQQRNVLGLIAGRHDDAQPYRLTGRGPTDLHRMRLGFRDESLELTYSKQTRSTLDGTGQRGSVCGVGQGGLRSRKRI